MEHSPSILSALLGLMFVLGLIFLISYLLKRFGGAFLSGITPIKRENGLEILEIKQIDVKNRLVVAKYQSKEYLLMTGENNIVVDSFESAINEIKGQDSV